MITVGTLEAKNRLSELLDRVEKGERVQITRHGKVVATLVGDEEAKHADAMQAVEEIRKLKEAYKDKVQPPITIEEILSWRDEGRRI